jgi:hypothetical protein
MNDDFENQLARYRLGAAPDHLAETLIAAARPHLAPPSRSRQPIASIVRLWASLLNVSPAVRALAAVWVIGLGVNAFVGSGFHRGMSVASRPEPEQMIELRSQRAQLLELAGLPETYRNPPPRPSQPRPRSELSWPFNVRNG